METNSSQNFLKMDQLQSQDTYNPNELVQKYIQDTTHARHLDTSTGILENLYCEVKNLFARILLLAKHCEVEDKARLQYSSLDRSYSRLVLWYDAFQSLCSTVHDEVPREIIESMLKHLQEIGITLTDRKCMNILYEGRDYYIRKHGDKESCGLYDEDLGRFFFSFG